MKHPHDVLWSIRPYLLVPCLWACAPAPEPPDLDDPLPGLTAEQLELFEAGEDIFEGTFTAEQGLGPLFNEVGCATCHDDPTDGGNGSTREVHVSGIGEEGACDALLAAGGPVIQQRATAALTAALGIESEPIPSSATAQGMRSTPDVFGFGLLDAIPDATLLALADPDDRDGDGVSGRAHWLPGGHIGRFGRKASVAALVDFNEGAFLAELGLTTPNQLEENSVAGAPLPAGVDPAAEPELSPDELFLTDSYVRFLAPPAPADFTPAARAGEHVFARIGCAACHVPSLRTGDHSVAALSNQVVHAYTDLLLHDMGAELADTCLADATPSEFRTEPLMGLRHVRTLLHDGRATSIEEAVLLHGGEGQRARDAFTALRSDERANLLEFLGSL